MTRRGLTFLLLAALAPAVFPQEPAAALRGVLGSAANGAPAVRLADGKLVYLEGDRETTAVIRDERLHGRDFEAAGSFTGPDRFRIAPRHTRAMWIREGGERLSISYWCGVCSIRTYAPGICMCCQEETELELRHEHEAR